jgi:hypothetical protein
VAGLVACLTIPEDLSHSLGVLLTPMPEMLLSQQVSGPRGSGQELM